MASVVLSYLIKQPYKEEILEHFDTNKGHESWSSYLSVSRDVCLDYKRKKGLYKGKVLGKYMAYLIMEENGPGTISSACLA